MLFRRSKEDKIFKQRLKKTLTFSPRNILLYKIAFSHRTKPFVRDGKEYTNETLEFLGDAVLNLIVANYLKSKFPAKSEGDLSIMRSNLVSRKQLNIIAKRLHIVKFLSKSKYTYIHNNIQGNTLEALFGAIFLDRSYKYAEKFFFTLINNNLIPENEYTENKNYKSLLLEKSSKEKFKLEIVPIKKHISGHTFFKSFIFVNQKLFAEGLAKRKKSSEQIASQRALKTFENYDTHKINIGNKRNNRR